MTSFSYLHRSQTHTGDKKVPLLRSTTVKAKHGEQQHDIFLKPYYIPVDREDISAIEIHIAPDTGDDIDFGEGKAQCVLHFRQQNYR